MKHLSLGLTVLLLGGLPLTAAAADYGLNSASLASADTTTSQSPTAQPRASSMGSMAGADSMEAAAGAQDGPAVAPRSTPPSMSPGIAIPPIPDRASSASNKQRSPATQPSPSTTEVGPATWQSLLPGSIQ